MRSTINAAIVACAILALAWSIYRLSEVQRYSYADGPREAGLVFDSVTGRFKRLDARHLAVGDDHVWLPLTETNAERRRRELIGESIRERKRERDRAE